MINHPNRARRKKVALSSEDHDYSNLLQTVQRSFAAATADRSRVFRTDAVGLNDIYLDALPAHRQLHNCSCCRRFLDKFGGLVTVSPAGDLRPVMWDGDGATDFYRPAFDALSKRVSKARIVSVFQCKDEVWGVPQTTTWEHFSVLPHGSLIYRQRAMTAGQAMAATRENYRTVLNALKEFKAPVLDEALRILRADALARSEKFVGPLQWLRDLHDRGNGRAGENILWRAIGSAPEGYCHPRSSVLAPLLDDIAAGMPFDVIKGKFEAMLHPLRYQRPQVAPNAGAIAAAEALVEKLGIARSLERRFARLDECQTIWRPVEAKPIKEGAGVFGHIRPKNSDAVDPVNLPQQTMTWDKFSRTILPATERMEMLVPQVGNFVALLTAEHADAPPIMKWDHEDERNPVSWYVYHGGSIASSWGLTAGWCPVTGVAPSPSLWGSRPMPELSSGVVLILEGAADERTGQGNALFPECLKSELHGARSVIEAYSKSARIGGLSKASACGYALNKKDVGIRVRVFANGGWIVYHLDRWD